MCGYVLVYVCVREGICVCVCDGVCVIVQIYRCSS